jgi:hypothetical protein
MARGPTPQASRCGLSIGLRRRSDGRLGPQATSTTLQTVPGNTRVMGRVLGISVSKVVLHRAQFRRRRLAA